MEEDIETTLDDFDTYDTEWRVNFNTLVGRLRLRRFRSRRAQEYEESLVAWVSPNIHCMVREAARLGAAGYHYGPNPVRGTWNFYIPLEDDAPISSLEVPQWILDALSNVGINTIGELVKRDWYELQTTIHSQTGVQIIQEKLGDVGRMLAPQPPMSFPC